MYFKRALQYGLSWNDFLKTNPKILFYYQTEYIRQQKEKAIKDNENAWLQGLYVANAIGSCFGKNKKYPKQPLDLGIEPKTDTMTDADKFSAWASAFNKKFKK